MQLVSAVFYSFYSFITTLFQQLAARDIKRQKKPKLSF